MAFLSILLCAQMPDRQVYRTEISCLRAHVIAVIGGNNGSDRWLTELDGSFTYRN